MYEQLKEKKGEDYCVFKEWCPSTWAGPCNG